MPRSVRRLSVILLAAGESTRMGRQKALLPWAGTTLLEYQLRELETIADVAEVVVVTGHEPEAITRLAAGRPNVRVAHNPDYKTGKVSSITAGVRAASPDADALILLAVDQPRNRDLLRRLIDAHHALVTVPTNDGRRGHPVIFDGSVRGELLAITEETLGIRAVLDRHVREVQEVDVETADALLDLNSPDDVPK